MADVYEITGNLVIDYRAREWCKLPYPDHPNGCPNYSIKPECPPQVAKIEDWLDLTKPHWIIVTQFNLSEHASRMKATHPEWSEKQCRCVLYWQNTPRKELRQSIKLFQKQHNGTIATLLPEAMGVHVLATAKRVGIPIIAKPIETIYKVAVVGYPKNQTRAVIRKCCLDYFTDTPAPKQPGITASNTRIGGASEEPVEKGGE